MRPFVSRDGRYIEPVEHVAKFKGKRNRSKSKVLIYLSAIQGKYLTAKELRRATGVSYAYLLSRLSFWFNIRYINRKPIATTGGRSTWAYCIAERGQHFVDNRIPGDKLQEYISEINAFHHRHD